MPAHAKSQVDWARGKREWCAGQLSQEAIAKIVGCKRQSLKERADKEGWIYGSDITAVPAEYSPMSPGTSEGDATAPEPDPLPTLEECLELVLAHSETVEKQRHATVDQLRQWKAQPDNLARALHGAHQNAKGQLLADIAGLHDQTLRRICQEDEAFGQMVRAAHATAGIRSLQCLTDSQARGDAGSAKYLLEKGPYAAEYGGASGVGGMTFNIVLNIRDPQPVDPSTILELEPDDVQIVALPAPV